MWCYGWCWWTFLYELSFNAHLNLATIHLWVDGNGRTARLLMNYIQFCYHLFPTKIFKEDREIYILSLRQCQDEETNQPFLDFMTGQLKKSISLEIERFKVSQKKGFCFMFWYYMKIRAHDWCGALAEWNIYCSYAQIFSLASFT